MGEQMEGETIRENYLAGFSVINQLTNNQH
jgi:hypothetical protein